MTECRVWIPIKPQVKERARWRGRRRGGMHTPDKTVAFENACRRAWNEAGVYFGNGPVGMELEIHQDGMFVTVYELEGSVRPVGILGDIDNYIKSVADSLQPNKNDPEGGVGAYANDRQVEHLQVFFVGVPRKPKKVKETLDTLGQ